jgi:hypothetical protein
MTERKQRPRFLKTATSEYKLSVKMGLPSSGFFFSAAGQMFFL